MDTPRHRHPTSADRGSVLVLTLVLTVVLAALVLALARYATVGLASSEVTTGRTESNAAASAAVTWVVEEFAAKRLQPEMSCPTDDSPIDVPSGVVPSATLSVTCSPLPEVDNHPAVRLDAVAVTDRASRTIEVVLQVPIADYNAQIRDWNAD